MNVNGVFNLTDLSSIDLALTTTRSVRKRIDFKRPVPARLINECIDVATQAPTGLRREAWRFLIITDPKPKEIVASLYREAFEEAMRERIPQLELEGVAVPKLGPSYRFLAEHLQEFPCLILVCSEGRPETSNVAQQVAFYGAVLPAAWSLMVSLRSRNIGSTWTTLLARHEDQVAKVLRIPPDVTQTVLLPAGFMKGAKLGMAARKSAKNVTFWNCWGRSQEG